MPSYLLCPSPRSSTRAWKVCSLCGLQTLSRRQAAVPSRFHLHRALCASKNGFSAIVTLMLPMSSGFWEWFLTFKNIVRMLLVKGVRAHREGKCFKSEANTVRRPWRHGPFAAVLSTVRHGRWDTMRWHVDRKIRKTQLNGG